MATLPKLLHPLAPCRKDRKLQNCEVLQPRALLPLGRAHTRSPRVSRPPRRHRGQAQAPPLPEVLRTSGRPGRLLARVASNSDKRCVYRVQEGRAAFVRLAFVYVFATDVHEL